MKFLAQVPTETRELQGQADGFMFPSLNFIPSFRQNRNDDVTSHISLHGAVG